MTVRVLLLSAGLLAAACADPAPPPPPPEAAEPVPVSPPSDPPGILDSLAVDSLAPAPAAPAAEDPTRGDPPAAPADGRYALLVGIDDYPGDGDDLPSGAADVAAMRTLLVGRFGYRPEHVRVLADRRATRGAVRAAIRDHLGRADGSALLYFSGHGVRLDGNAGRADAEADGRDEAVYVWADDGRRSSLVADDEIGAWMGALAARHAVVVLDACHSGTGARAAAGGPRGKEVVLKDVEAALDPAAPWRGAVGPPGRPVVLLAAARDQEVALAGLDGDPSVFTGALAAVFGRAAPETPLADAMGEVSARVRRLSRRWGSEHRPQLEATAGLTLADVFSR